MGCSSGNVFRIPGRRSGKKDKVITAENVSGSGASIDIGVDAKWGWDCWVLPLELSQPGILRSSSFRCFFNILSFTLVKPPIYYSYLLNFSISQAVVSTPSSLRQESLEPQMALFSPFWDQTPVALNEHLAQIRNSARISGSGDLRARLQPRLPLLFLSKTYLQCLQQKSVCTSQEF